jgi:hypothetical protein
MHKQHSFARAQVQVSTTEAKGTGKTAPRDRKAVAHTRTHYLCNWQVTSPISCMNSTFLFLHVDGVILFAVTKFLGTGSQVPLLLVIDAI